MLFYTRWDQVRWLTDVYQVVRWQASPSPNQLLSIATASQRPAINWYSPARVQVGTGVVLEYCRLRCCGCVVSGNPGGLAALYTAVATDSSAHTAIIRPAIQSPEGADLVNLLRTDTHRNWINS